jgi:hypothetical protein
MPTWNIDKAIVQLEKAVLRPGAVSGTMLTRGLLDHSMFPRFGLKIPADRQDRECTLVWTLSLGELLERKHFFYGLTLRAAYLAARRHFKKELLASKHSCRRVRKPQRRTSDDCPVA